MPLLVTEVGLGRAQAHPVGLRLQTLRGCGDELFVDALASGLAQQVLDHPFAVVVLTLAEVVVPDPALCICEVDGRPVSVAERAPDPVVTVESDRVLDPHGLRGLADVFDVALERELRRVDADDDQTSIAVLLGPRANEGQRAEPVDAGVRPEVNENDLSSQTPPRERGRVQPAGCPFETGQATLDGEHCRARVPARTEEAHSYATFRPISRSGWRLDAVFGALHGAFSATAGGPVTGPRRGRLRM